MFAASRIAYPAWIVTWITGLFAALLLASGALAQGNSAERPVRYGDGNIAVQLIADGAPRAGEEWMLALRFTPSSEEWHGYWSNPGDAGLGMQLALDLPAGWEMGEALYPVPERFIQQLPTQSLMNHIYKGPYTVLVPVSVPASAVIEGLPDVRGYVEYLSCTDVICVPQDASLSAGQASISGGDFARWRAQVAPMLDASARFSITGDMLRIAYPASGIVDAGRPACVYRSSAARFLPDPAQALYREGDMLVADVPLDPLGTRRG